jgi:hypothetical protein
VFGAYCHTTYVSEKDAYALYEVMKSELQVFMDKETTEEEEIEFYEQFCEKY